MTAPGARSGGARSGRASTEGGVRSPAASAEGDAAETTTPGRGTGATHAGRGSATEDEAPPAEAEGASETEGVSGRANAARGGATAAASAAGGSPAGEGPAGPVVVSPSVYRRLMSGLPGYAVAMLCCLAIVGLVLLITPRRYENAIARVDYRGDLAGLVAVAPYAVWAPEGLPAGWYPTSSRLTGTTGGPVAWHLGFYTPGKQYAALEESDERPGGHGGFVDRMTSQGRPDGTATVAGARWDRAFRKDKNQRSLVRRLPGVTLVVTGTASYDELAVLAGSLRQQPKPSPSATRQGE